MCIIFHFMFKFSVKLGVSIKTDTWNKCVWCKLNWPSPILRTPHNRLSFYHQNQRMSADILMNYATKKNFILTQKNCSRDFFNATMSFLWWICVFLYCYEIWNFLKAFINSPFLVDEFSGIKHGLVFEWRSKNFILTFSKPKWQINWIIHYKN